jgi:uncharacterized membrane protein
MTLLLLGLSLTLMNYYIFKRYTRKKKDDLMAELICLSTLSNYCFPFMSSDGLVYYLSFKLWLGPSNLKLLFYEDYICYV